MRGVTVSLTYGPRFIVYAEEGAPEAPALRAALGEMLAVLDGRGPWVRLARAYVQPPNAPGDCFYVPPACLLDLDERDRRAARRWALAVGTLTHPETRHRFVHCWPERDGAVVSVSNLTQGYPAYANLASRYYQTNGATGHIALIRARALRTRARAASLGGALARWIAAHASPSIGLSSG